MRDQVGGVRTRSADGDRLMITSQRNGPNDQRKMARAARPAPRAPSDAPRAAGRARRAGATSRQAWQRRVARAPAAMRFGGGAMPVLPRLRPRAGRRRHGRTAEIDPGEDEADDGEDVEDRRTLAELEELEGVGVAHPGEDGGGAARAALGHDPEQVEGHDRVDRGQDQHEQQHRPQPGQRDPEEACKRARRRRCGRRGAGSPASTAGRPGSAATVSGAWFQTCTSATRLKARCRCRASGSACRQAEVEQDGR